ncbi:pseudouridine synthase [Aureococcus anophagefferens]|nr:pseudouridine synthase [Aureococcus anophagefferens]
MFAGALALAPRRVVTRHRAFLAATADDGSTRPWATFRVVFEDDEVIVCDKGSGLLAVPGRGDHKQDSLITRLRATRGASTTLAHRLDRDTSGLVVAAKTNGAAEPEHGPPPVFVAALQHLAAGIVLSAVAVEPSVSHTECSPARVEKSGPP